MNHAYHETKGFPDTGYIVSELDFLHSKPLSKADYCATIGRKAEKRMYTLNIDMGNSIKKSEILNS